MRLGIIVGLMLCYLSGWGQDTTVMSLETMYWKQKQLPNSPSSKYMYSTTRSSISFEITPRQTYRCSEFITLITTPNTKKQTALTCKTAPDQQDVSALLSVLTTEAPNHSPAVPTTEQVHALMLSSTIENSDMPIFCTSALKSFFGRTKAHKDIRKSIPKAQRPSKAEIMKYASTDSFNAYLQATRSETPWLDLNINNHKLFIALVTDIDTIYLRSETYTGLVTHWNICNIYGEVLYQKEAPPINALLLRIYPSNFEGRQFLDGTLANLQYTEWVGRQYKD